MRDSYKSYVVNRIKQGQILSVMKEGGKYAGIFASRILKKPLTGPIHGIFIVNYHCNLKCEFCDLPFRPVKRNKEVLKLMKTEEMKKVIDDFKAIGTTGIGFTGGEPILRGDIPELVGYAHSKGLLTHLSTNGFFMNDKNVRALVSNGLDAVSFSLDGSTSEIHDHIRGIKGSYQKVLDGIANFKRIKAELGKKTVVIVVSVMTNKNFHQAMDTIKIARGAGADLVSFAPVHDIGLMKQEGERIDESNITEENLEKVDKVIDEIIALKKKVNYIDSSEQYLQLFKQAFRYQKLPIKCYAGYVTIGVDGYGQIFPCFSYMEMDKSFGNIKDTPLREFWSDGNGAMMREKIRDCRDCYWNNQTELNLLFSNKKF